MKSKQVLSVEQMKHLQEIGLELRNYRFGVKAYLVKIMYTLLTPCRTFLTSCRNV